MANFVRLILLASILLLSACGPRAYAPRIKGIWNPQVGSGAVYSLRSKEGEPMKLEYAVVGKEGTRYWVESTVADTMMKTLIDPAEGRADRLIMQTPGNPPIEMTQMMKIGQSILSSGAQQIAETNIKETSTVIGKETVTTPAGSFPTTHYRSVADDGAYDVWIAESVRPYGLVKMQSPAGDTMELVQVLKNATSRVGTP